MDSGTLGVILSIAGIIITVVIGANKFIIKSSGNIKNIKYSNISMSNVNIGKDNKIVKGDMDEGK